MVVTIVGKLGVFTLGALILSNLQGVNSRYNPIYN